MNGSGEASSKAAVAEAWARLRAIETPALAELFAVDPARTDVMTRRISWPVMPGSDAQAGMVIDFAKTHLGPDALTAFEALAEAAGFDAARAALFDGGIVNLSEGRAATHGALRGSGTPAQVEEAEALLARMGMLVEAIHQGALGEVQALHRHRYPARSTWAGARDRCARPAIWRWSMFMSSRISTGWHCNSAVCRLRPCDHADRARLEDLHHHRDDDQCGQTRELAWPTMAVAGSGWTGAWR